MKRRQVRDQRAHVFRGDYAKFLVEREERVQRALKEYEEQQREIDKLESYITRFGAKMSHAASAQSKRKMLVRASEGEREREGEGSEEERGGR
jgi:ATP-binding cassette, subfamily F, member 3